MSAATFYDPDGDVYGLPTYPYRMAPAGLATRRQLARRGLTPGRQPIAAQILWRHGRRRADLYRVDLAATKRPATARQRAALARAETALRTCATCGQVRAYRIPPSLGECITCSPLTKETSR
ncbi:RRQRL motif-containing zinc-binding protein [Phytomonospora sp. NPDC050363]|uniref:RRQRL motif-containing zinc-binding protein n=1 Tax=Phytomonospora sp. NPDC050363 TaxID=3155642 RepID=UPI0033ECCB0E